MTAPTPVVVKVDKDPRDPNLHLPHEERVGECLMLAAEYQAENGGLLCHGSIFHPVHSEQRIGHAWVVNDDESLFEPTLGLAFPHWSLYFQWANAKVDSVYTQEQAAIHMLTKGHYGTWDEDVVSSGVWGEGVSVVLPIA